nr:hypothetical protein [Trichoderma asperellum]
MPCVHYIAEKDLNEPLLRIRDPDVVENLRGRPRLPQNSRVPVDRNLQPITTPSLPTSSQPGGRRLPSSIRRTRTAAEVEAASQGASQTRPKRSRVAGSNRGRGNRGGRQRGRGRASGTQGTQGTQRLAVIEESSTADAAAEVEEVIPATQIEP